MAAAAVGGAFLSSFVNVLFDRLSSPEFANLIRGKKLDQKLLQKLETILYAVQAVLNDAEQKQINDSAVKKWLVNLEDAVYVADDLLDEVSTKAATQKDAGNFWSRYLNLQDREMVTKIEGIIDTLEAIVKHKDILGLQETAKEKNVSWRTESTSLVEGSSIYGRDGDKEAVLKLLLDDTSDGMISVIPIVGMGGIGKTTLALMVYNDDKAKERFDFRAWVCVSEEFDVLKVTKTVIEAVTSSSCNLNDLNSLQIGLKEKLSGKKFLIVLDDVWSDDYDFWVVLQKPFQYGSKGSKIIVTTRSNKVACAVQTTSAYQLSLLSDEDCWLVFAKHARLSLQSQEHLNLEKLGKEIVRKCKGLPLAAQTLGGLLRTNRDLGDWNNILMNNIWEFSENESKIIPALSISYHYLLPHLKRCFVYCSLYPKDYHFDRDDLILLWMAEDFLQPKGRKTLEETGYEYFHELVSRSFFHPSTTYGDLFVMHDLMHDLATFYAGEFYFRVEKLRSVAEIGIKIRHLSHNARGNYPMSKLLAAGDRVKHMRTFLEINLLPFDKFNKEDALILISQLKNLRVLSIENFPIDCDSLPHLLGELIHLRYLNLSFTHIATLPQSISNLYNLQTLKLKGCFRLKMLPNSMQDLVNLRHLDIRGTGLKEMPKGMSKLKHLQLLTDFIVGKNEENGIKELGALDNLHGSLNIHKLENVINSGEALEARMVDKKHINILVLSWSPDGNIANSQTERDILGKLQPHRDLKELSIEGYRGTTFPDWLGLGHSSYHNMTKVYLGGCRNCCMLPPLGQLPSLKHLLISGLDGLEIIGDEFYKIYESCQQTPFPSLETLAFDKMSCWWEWRSFGLDAFPKLKELAISFCPRLMGGLPNHLPALEKLTIQECEQFACSLPRAHVILELRILGKNELRIQELPRSLRSLVIEECQPVESMSFPGACMPSSLQKLKIMNCKKLEFSMQQQHESLQSLIISYSCDSLTSFPLVAFPNLTTLKIRGCENLECLVVSQSQNAITLSSLHSLTIAECPIFTSISTLGLAAPQLERLKIEHCPEIDSFSEEDLPPNLRELSIIKCEKLTSCLASMDLHCRGLTYIEIKGACGSIKSFPKAGWLPASLEFIYLKDFPSLETLDCNGFVHLTSLQKLSVDLCPKLENMVGERLPASVTTLHMYNIPLLGKRFEIKDLQVWSKISHIPTREGRW